MSTSNFVTTPATAAATLSRLVEVFKLNKVPAIPPLTSKIGDVISYSHDVLSVEAAASIGYGGAFSAASSGKSMLLVMDYMRSAFVPANDPAGVLHGVTYGAGFRVLLAVMNVEGEVQLSLAGVAAQAQLGYARVNLKIDILGLPDLPPKTVSSGLLSFDSYDVKVHDELVETIARLLEYAEKAENCRPQLIGLTTRKVVDSSFKAQTESVLFAMRRIQKQTSLAAGLEAATSKKLSIDEAIVRATYAEHLRNAGFLLPDDERDAIKPSEDDATRAGTFLSRYKDL